MLRLKILDSAGVFYDGLNFQPVPDDASVGPKSIYIRRPHSGNGIDVPIGEGRSKAIPLVQYHLPGESGLENLKAHDFEQAVVVVYPLSPYRVYIPIP